MSFRSGFVVVCLNAIFFGILVVSILKLLGIVEMNNPSLVWLVLAFSFLATPYLSMMTFEDRSKANFISYIEYMFRVCGVLAAGFLGIGTAYFLMKFL